MNVGKALALIWDVAVWFFVLSVLVLPALYAQWRHREKQDQAATEEALRGCKADTSGDHIFDGA